MGHLIVFFRFRDSEKIYVGDCQWLLAICNNSRTRLHLFKRNISLRKSILDHCYLFHAFNWNVLDCRHVHKLARTAGTLCNVSS